MRTRTRATVVAAVALLVLLAFVPPIVRAYTDWLWFGEVGYRGVWVRVFLTRWAVFLVIGALVGGAIFAGMGSAFRTRPLLMPSRSDPLEPYRRVVLQRLRVFGIGIPVVIGALAGLIAQNNWATVQLFVHGAAFGSVDPEFGLDVGFFVFDLPFYRWVLGWLFVAVFLAGIANVTTNYLFGGITVGGKLRKVFSSPALIQVALLAGVFVLLKAVAYWLDRYALVSAGHREPAFAGAGYTDINAVLPAKFILCAIALLCAVACFAVIKLRDLRIPLLALALLFLSSILVGGVWPFVVEQFSVRPNAAVREAPYIERGIEATRQAYRVGDDTVEYVPYRGVGTTPPQDVPSDVTTIANIRLLDPDVLSRTFTQQQQLKNFYEFPRNLDLDRYRIDGQMRDFVVGVRELSPERLTGNQTHWVNRHTVYTHGNGFVAAPANRVNAAVRDATDGASSSDSGYPLYTVSDIATHSTEQVIPVEQPRVYFGEVIGQSGQEYVIVGGDPGEAPREYDTDTSSYTYDGEGGVAIGNWFNRLAFSVRYGERNIIFSGEIGSESKILFHRDPAERVHMVAPWLETDTNPYPAVVDGRIVWIVDGYTTADQYPYSQRSALPEPDAMRPQAINYMRNSVKATVDAYDGTVTLYEVDSADPVLQTWMGVFPGTVRPESEVPDGLRDHFRYPEDLFRVQREILARYHVDDPVEFFTTNAFWSVPSDPTVDTNPNQPPYYVLVGDEEAAQPSFRLAGAMVGFHREFLSAYISARSDPDGYGKITVLELPTDSLTQGPQQTQNSMISDTRVASERTLLERSNRIHYGNLLTLPIAEGGMLYVEPLYTERMSAATDGSTFPQLARVLVSYRDPQTGGVLVGYAPTLAEALDQVLGRGAGSAATPPGGDAATVPEEAPPPVATPAPAENPEAATAAQNLQAALDELRSAQRSGDFRTLGAALDRLQSAVDAYVVATGGGQ
ncbi:MULTISPECIES: UPF0182 family protein [unclassified Rhodococcus (in: high G+C Gram-positive bacteria)]|uniref:UPF0182 family protein n=1 Tax=Rhodococcus sp. SJ-3 TaxID=3454628 RepID=UPI003F7A4AA6